MPIKKSHPRDSFLWSGRRDSNSRQSAWKADTLPTELLPHALFNFHCPTVGRVPIQDALGTLLTNLTLLL